MTAVEIPHPLCHKLRDRWNRVEALVCADFLSDNGDDDRADDIRQIANGSLLLFIEDIQSRMTKSGSHFFSEGNMRFHKSRVSDTVYRGPGGIFFVTSERDWQDVRRYNVRRFCPVNVSIQTVGEYGQYGTLSQAKSAAKYLAKEGIPDVK